MREKKKFSLSFSPGNNSNLSEILPFKFFFSPSGKLLVKKADGTDESDDHVGMFSG